MNCELMCQYIEFVADRLLVELGCSKQWRRGVFYKLGRHRLSIVHESLIMVEHVESKFLKPRKKTHLILWK